ncbi:hypothetical protein PTSG_01976 [Salpingoeca rosetta]|uniref:Tyrosine-protein kinase ephrin type A/B receptor-like domain-containing protein n=1 Tax=Salpingoeca rosetta (strain ATCC 50818 / BSB-021) TaxID=946362 RepID=F2TZI1_SALR5|nr:uncharacterized protein PTSG_01976 [Salpingoeca rosetta]EGD79005.1 hypothetical protein PTSG_01976 [Salpingoeca rosetta]|eukprot:XP_004997961.1 hypothetical protein PTSG_01976 [Salpingoeca rosetta]
MRARPVSHDRTGDTIAVPPTAPAMTAHTACPGGTWRSHSSGCMKSRRKTPLLPLPLLHATVAAMLCILFLTSAGTVRAATSCQPGEYLNINATCIECLTGYTCSGGVSAAMPCPTGTYNPVPGQSSQALHCLACEAGDYTTARGSTSCQTCPAGHTCADPAAEPTECPQGSYAPAGSTTCKACPAGSKCPYAQLAAPIACANGTYALANQTSCSLCPAGYSCPDASAAIACGVGYYSPQGEPACTICPLGTFCASNTTEAPELCAEGSYAMLGQEACTACPAGYYCPHADEQPVACSNGTYTSSTGAITCLVCEAGRDCSTKTSSTPCPAGTYSGQGLPSCEPCAEGYYANATGLSHCLPCPPGYTCANPAYDPVLCSAGYYSEGTNGTSGAVCIACPRGTTSTPARTGCDDCPQGHHCNDPTIDPQPCPAGTYSAGGTVKACTTCTAGFYCPAQATQPLPCVSGTFSGAGASNCTACPAGYACSSTAAVPVACDAGYISDEGETTCRPCGLGNFCPSSTEGPYPCPVGTYTVNATSQSCLPCPTDHACPSATATPVLCSFGQTVSATLTTCEPCPAGFSCPTPSSTPQPCTPGNYSTEGSGSCTACPAGSACPTTSASPEACSPGSYSTEGSTHCTRCPPGYECPSTADTSLIKACRNGTYALGSATACELCDAGAYCPSTSQGPQGTCPPGTYSLDGQASCTLCPAGSSCQYNDRDPAACAAGSFSEAGALECTVCPPGFACPYTTQAIMHPCDIGSYSEAGSTTCNVCPAGFACPSVYGDTRVSCATGWFSTVNATSCTPCPAGYKCPTSDSDSRTACDPGTYSLGATDTCTDCTAGSYCPSVALPPRVCPPGTYSSDRATQCTACRAGYFCTTTTETLCNEGFWSAANSTYCEPCDSGYLCDAGTRPHTSPNGNPCAQGGYCNGATRTECPDGTYGNVAAKGTLHEACFECPAGSYCDGTGAGATTPTACPAGYYCPAGTGRIDLQPCPAGYYALSGGSKESLDTGCTLCPEGYYCPQASVNPIICPQGYFCPTGTEEGTQNSCPSGTYGATVGFSDASNCTICPIGYYCPDGHNTHPSVSPLPCPGGTYNPFTGAGLEVDCIPCPSGRSCSGTGRNNTNPCEQGHYCPRGTVTSTQYPCPPGTYTDSTSLGAAEECSPCPAGSACGWATGYTDNVPLSCSQGHYCPTGTPTPTSFPCAAGTYTARSNLTAASECSTCPERYYCDGGEGSPTDWCPSGYYCLAGTQAFFQHPCPAGTYQPEIGSYLESECFNCTVGHYCEEATTTPVACPAGTYMPYGSERNDTMGSEASRILSCKIACRDPDDFVSLTTVAELEQCELACEQGSNCATHCGTVSAEYTTACNHGCDSYDSAAAYVQVGVSAGAASECITCPAGYSCSSATVDPVPCGRGFYSEAGSEACERCPAGYYCDEAAVSDTVLVTSKACNSSLYCTSGLSAHDDAVPCPRGHYCPQGTALPVTCPVGTYNPDLYGASLADCHPCDAGMYCVEASVNPTGACNKGYYCPTNITASEVLNGVSGLLIGSYGPKQEPCPAGTYRNATGGQDLSSCATCPEASYCPIASAVPITCPRGFYCPLGSAQPQPCPKGTIGNSTGLIAESDCEACPGGFYCDRLGSWQTTAPCDPGYVCTLGAVTSAPTDNVTGSICPAGGYCPPGSAVSQPCPQGTFNNVTGSVDENDCVPCTPGYYCASTRSPGPTGPCDAGYYCTSESKDRRQFVTPVGHYTTAGSSAPIPCNPGTYQTATGKGSCDPCPAGTYCPDFGMNSTVECPRGFFCPEGSTSFSGPNGNQRCPIGTYGAFSGIANTTGCVDCPPGQYCASPEDGSGLMEPTGPCAAGYICYGNAEFATPGLDGLSWGAVCPPGYYCPEGTQAPVPCPPGSYSNVEGLQSESQCTPCPAARYCPEEAMTTYGAYCAEGYYCILGSAVARPLSNNSVQLRGLDSLDYYYTTQNLTLNTTRLAACGLLDFGGDVCPQGHYCPTGVEAEYIAGFPSFVWEGGPILCAEGTYANFTGAAECWTCPAGFACFNREPFDANPLPCPEGHYCPQGTDSNIPECPVGTYNNRTGLQAETDCTPCPPGLACTVTGLSDPDAPCAEGFWCGRGAFSTRPRTSSPLAATTPSFDGGQCPEAHYCPEGSSAPTPCPPGTISAAVQASSNATCTACPPGFYCEAAGQTQAAAQCAAGYYCVSGATSPRPTDGVTGDVCPAGTYCEAGSHTPANCPPGSYNALTGQSNCTTCPAGFYCEEGASDYTATPCDAGHYCPNGTAHSTQVPCPVGTYLNTTGAATEDACVPCTPGYYCPTTGLVQATLLCDEGYYCSGGSHVARPQVNGTDVATCPGISAGGMCQAGTYCPQGAPAPLPCEAGRACTTTGLSASNKACSAGFVCLGGAQTTRPTDGVTGYRCPAGYYCPAGSSEPTPCPAGTYSQASEASDSSTCLACLLGHACTAPATTSPEACDAGYHCSVLGLNTTSPADLLCDPGYYCPNGTTQQLACPSGTYQNEAGMATCKECPAGFVCDATSSPVVTGTATPCPVGHYCPAGTEVGTANPCPVGTIGNETGLANVTQCHACPPGHYCDEAGLTEPAGECAGGYYCQSGATTPQPLDGVTGDVCPSGNYCPQGSINPVPCPAGSITTLLAQDEVGDCQPCDPGEYCPAGSSAGDCDAGYVCVRGSATAQPTTLAFNAELGVLTGGYMCPNGTYCPAGAISDTPCARGTYAPMPGLEACTPCPAGQLCEELGTINPADCPLGFYCEQGVVTPEPCPIGTFGGRTGLRDVTECTLCEGGHFCDETALTAPKGECDAGYLCAGGDTTPAPTGPTTSILGDDTNFFSVAFVTIFIDGEELNVTSGTCPRGHYCTNGTASPVACPAGYYNPDRRGASLADCTPCPARYYCADTGMTTYTSTCAAGYYCPESAAIATSQPAGYECPLGHRCLAASDAPEPCPDGEYQDVEAQSECKTCPAGSVCEYGRNSSVTPEPCPLTYFCEAGTGLYNKQLCANGTYGAATGYAQASDCVPCPPGKYCNLGVVEGNCHAGYICLSSSTTPQPSGDDADVGSPCPAGYVCPEGTLSPQLCPNGTVVIEGLEQQQVVVTAVNNDGDLISVTRNITVPTLGEGAASFDACDTCPASLVCAGAVVTPCPTGHYCPAESSEPVPCAAGFYNALPASDDPTDCSICPAGYWCRYEGTSDFSDVPCPQGYYCPVGTTTPRACPPGTWSNETAAMSADDCQECPAGFFCPENATTRVVDVCPSGHFCPAGSAEPRVCTAGYYCPTQSGEPRPSPDGYYSPFNSSDPIPCPAGHYCPAPAADASTVIGDYPSGATEAILCPLGYRDRVEGGGNHDRTTLDSACVACEAGKYGSHPTRAVCFDCEPGFVCLEGAIYGNPDVWTAVNATRDRIVYVNGNPYSDVVALDVLPYTGVGFNYTVNGYPDTKSYQCPPGYYCPRQSPYPLPCPEGTYNPNNRSVSVDACVSCPAGTYNNRAGQSFCRSCGSSSFSDSGASLCTCRGENRVFSPADATCVCRPLYASRDGATLLTDVEDGVADCQPIVFDNCPEGSVLNEHGQCLDDSGWLAYCQAECALGPTPSVYDAGLGRCLCKTPALDDVCDISCRAEERQRQQIVCESPPRLVINQVNADGSVDEVISIYTSELGVGALGDIGLDACPTLDGRRLPSFLMVANSDGLTGGYNVPTTVWEGLDVSGASRRRRSSDAAAQSMDGAQGAAGHAGSTVLSSNLTLTAAADGELPRARRPHVRLRREEWVAQLANPVACLELGAVVVFSVNGTNYPVYDKNNLLNRQDDPERPFIHAPLVALAEELQSDPSARSFAYAFTSPGVWVLRDAGSGRTSVFSVMGENVECPDNGPFFPATSSSQHLLTVSREDSLVVTPDWRLMGFILAGAAALVMVVLAATSYFRTAGWVVEGQRTVSYRQAATRYPIEDMSSKGSQRERVQRINRKALEFDLSDPANEPPPQGKSTASNNNNNNNNHGADADADAAGAEGTKEGVSQRLKVLFDDDFWDYERQVDLENFTAETLFDLIDGRTQEVHRQIQAKSDEVKKVYENIRHEASLLKSLWVSKLRLARPVELSPLPPGQPSNTQTLSKARDGYGKELESRKSLGDRWYQALVARRDMLARTFRQSNDLYQDVLSRVEEVRTQVNLVIALQRFAQQQRMDNSVVAEGRVRCEQAVIGLREALIKGTAQLLCSSLVGESDVESFGARLLPPEDGGDEPVPTEQLRDPVDGGLVSGEFIQRSEILPGLFVPVAGTRLLLADGSVQPCSPTEHVVDPRTARVLPVRGNVAYNMVTRQLFVVVDFTSISTHSAPLLYVPWPAQAQAQDKACAFSDGTPLQSSLRTDGTMVHAATGLTVPMLACTTHPATKEIVPVGGVYDDPVTHLPTPIQRYLPGPASGHANTIIVDVDISDEGDAVPVCVPMGNLDTHTHIASEEPLSGRVCLSNHVSLRTSAASPSGSAPVMPKPHGVSWVSGLDALCLQSYRSCLTEVERLPVLLADEALDPLALSSSLASAVSSMDSQLRDVHSIFKRTARLKHSLFSDILLRFAEALSIREDGGVLGHLDEGNVPLFVGQRLYDRESKLEVPVLGVAYEKENERHVPLGGVMHSPDTGELAPISIGAAYVDPDSGEKSRVQGARVDPNTGRVVPSRQPCVRQRTFKLTDDDLARLEEELAARRAWQRRTTNQDNGLLRELQRLMATVLEMDDSETSKVSSHLETLAETLTSRSQQMRREQKRRKEEEGRFDEFPGVLTAMLFSNDKQEASLSVRHLQQFENVLGACKRFLAACTEAQEERDNAYLPERDGADNTDLKDKAQTAFENALDGARLELLESLSMQLAHVHESRATLQWISVDDELRASVVKEILGKMLRQQDRAQSGEDDGQNTMTSLENLISVLQHQASILRTQSTTSTTGLSASGRFTLAQLREEAEETAPASTTPPKQPRMAVPAIAVVEEGDDAETDGTSAGLQTQQAEQQQQQQGADSGSAALEVGKAGGMKKTDSKKKKKKKDKKDATGTLASKELEKLVEIQTQGRTALDARLYEAEREEMDKLLEKLRKEEEDKLGELTADLMRKLVAAGDDEAAQQKLLDAYEEQVATVRKQHQAKADMQVAELMQRLTRIRYDETQRHYQRERDTLPNHPDIAPPPNVTEDDVQAQIKEMLLEQQRLIASLEAGKRASAEEADQDGQGGGAVVDFDKRMEAFANSLTNKSTLRGGDKDAEALAAASTTAKKEVASRAKVVTSVKGRLRAKLEKRRAEAVGKAKTDEERAQVEASYDSQLATLSSHVTKAVDDELARTQQQLVKEFVAEDKQEEAAQMLREHQERMQQVRDKVHSDQRDKVMARIAAQKRLAAQRRRERMQKQQQEKLAAASGSGDGDDEGSKAKGSAAAAVDDGSKHARDLANKVAAASVSDEEAKKRMAELEQAHLKRLEELEAQKQAQMKELSQKVDAEITEAQQKAEADLQKRREESMQAAEQRMREEQERAKAQLSPEEFEKFMNKHRQQLSEVQSRLDKTQQAQRQALQERLKKQRERRRKANESKLEEQFTTEMSKQSEEREQLQSDMERANEEKVLRAAVKDMSNSLSVDSAAGGGGGGGQSTHRDTVIHRVMRARHLREFGRLVERCAVDMEARLRQDVGNFREERAEEREKIEERYEAELAEVEERDASAKTGSRDERFKIRRKLKTALANFDKKTARLVEQLEARVRLSANTDTERRKLELKQRQYNEMVEAFKNFSPDSEVHAQYEEAANQAKEAAEEYKKRLGAERQEQMKKLKEEQERLRKERHEKMEAERKRVLQELEAERQKQEQLMQQKQQRNKKKMMEQMRQQQAHELEKLDEAQRQEVMERHRRGLKNLEDALESEQDRQRQKFRERLNALKARKQEARLRELEEKEEEEQARAEEEFMAKELELQQQLHSQVQATVRKRDLRPTTPFVAGKGKKAKQPGGAKKQGQRRKSRAAAADTAAVSMLDEGLAPMLSKIESIEALLAGYDGAVAGQLGDDVEEEWASRSGDAALFTNKDDDGSAGEVDVVGDDEATQRQRMSLQLAEFVCRVARERRWLDNDVRLQLAKRLPAPVHLQNAFRFSYAYNRDTRTLSVRAQRADEPTQLLLVVIHALAHIKVDNMDGDHTGVFRKAFHSLLRLVCFDVLLSGCIAPASADGGDGGDDADRLQLLLHGLQRQSQSSKPLVKLLDDFSHA